MNYVEKRILEYVKHSDEIKSGNKNYVPFIGLGNLVKYVPGIIPGTMYKVTSGSGAGKTQFTKFAFVYNAIIYSLKHKIDYEVVYIALEESREEFVDGLFVHVCRRIFGQKINRYVLNGYSKDPLTEKELDGIQKAKHFVDKMMSKIHLIDNKYKPDDIYAVCLEIAKKDGIFLKDSKGNEKYFPHNPKQVRVVITDHISLVEEQYIAEKSKFLDLKQSMSLWHTNYQKRIITKIWKWAAVNVQQQGLDSEKQVFNNKGETVVNKLLPTMDGLGDNRVIARDDYVIIGLFAPERFRIEELYGYNIMKPGEINLKDNFRLITLIKNRFGTPNKNLPLFFDGSYNYFEPMPDKSDKKAIEDLINKTNL